VGLHDHATAIWPQREDHKPFSFGIRSIPTMLNEI
jgi:hypothetical protein